MKNDKKEKKKFHDLYFEGIIQIRGNDEEKIAEVADEILRMFEKTSYYISKIEPVRGGVDMYSTNNRMSQRAGKFLYKKYGGEYKESKKLFSLNKQTSKEIFRVNILFRIPEFFKGDIITLKENVLKIVKYSKDSLKAINLGNNSNDNGNKNKNVSFKVSEEIKNSIKIHSKKYTAKIALKKPVVQILHPETYQMIEVVNPPKNSEIGAEIKIVIVDDCAYVIE